LYEIYKDIGDVTILVQTCFMILGVS